MHYVQQHSPYRPLARPSHTQLHLKGPKGQRASRARFPDGDYCCHSRVPARAPNTLTRVLDFSEWFIKTENKQPDHVETCSKPGGHNRKLISGRKCFGVARCLVRPA